MIEFGKTLKSAREAKGLSVAQLAEATHLLPRVVEDLEKEDFSRLPAPIYGRGFVKLYCEQVGLDPKPMIAEFMDILNGSRDTVVREHPAAVPPPAPAPAPVNHAPIQAAPVIQPEPITAPEPPIRPAVKPVPADDLFAAAESRDAAQILADTAATPEPAPAAPAAPKLSRYATSYDNLVSDEPGARWTASPAIWRWVVVGVVAAAFLVLVFLGLRALYRATSPEPAPIDETTAAALGESAKPESAAPAPVPDEKAKLANAGRTPMDIAPLYVD